jgi:hypothetical protein
MMILRMFAIFPEENGFKEELSFIRSNKKIEENVLMAISSIRIYY